MNSDDSSKNLLTNTPNPWQKVIDIISESIPEHYETDADGHIARDINGNFVKKHIPEALK